VVADSVGAAAPDILPVKFHDDPIMTVPVLKPDAIGRPDGVAGHRKKKSFWKPRRKPDEDTTTKKQMTPADYLKYYAKDAQGRYTGSEDPAVDCILRGADLEKWRGRDSGTRDDGASMMSSAPPSIMGSEAEPRDVIR